MALVIIPMELREANVLVAQLHRHHKPVVGHRFSIGAYDTKQDRIVGAAIIGRPVARAVNHHSVVEVTRLVTDGTKNACSFLYAAAARVARELGYAEIQTYILDSEDGISLVAAGWREDGFVRGREWGCPSRARKTDNPVDKRRYSRKLNDISDNVLRLKGELR